MRRGRTRGFVITASIAGVAGMPVSVFAQDAASAAPGAAAPAAAPVVEPQAVAAPQPEPGEIGFNFKDTPVDRVLDYFARESGLPVIFEAPAPQGTITFVSSGMYRFEEAMSILNLNLHRFGVHLRREQRFLYLGTLQDSVKRPTPVAEAANADALPPDQFITVSIALDNARADLVAEQIKPLLSAYGGVVSVPAQNMVVLVESAAQVARIRQVIGAIDATRPVDSAFKLFPMKHASAEAVVTALKGLLGERVVTTFIDKDGRKTTAQEVTVAGLNLQHDPRTNSVIAVGAPSRIKNAEELIALLDVPEASRGGGLTTFVLSAVSTEEAARQVNALFAQTDPKKRPVVLTIPDQAKVTVAGEADAIAQAGRLLAELDPGVRGNDGQPPMVERRAVAVPLTHASAQSLEGVLSRLLTERQQRMIKFVASPDGASLLVSGPDAEIAQFEKMVRTLDAPRAEDRDVRVVKLPAASAAATMEKARALYTAARGVRAPIESTIDAQSGSVMLAGTRDGLSAFVRYLAEAQAAAVELESRSIEVKNVRPTEIAARAERLGRVLLSGDNGVPVFEPKFEAADEIGVVIVRALPQQMETLTALIAKLDSSAGEPRELRVVKLTGRDPEGLLTRARAAYAERTKGLPPERAGAVDAQYDPASGSALITGRAEGVRLFAEALGGLSQLLPPQRTTRVLDVNNVAARTIVGPLMELLKNAEPIDPARKIPDPTVQVLESTNSLLVTAEEAQHALVRDLTLRLDRLEQSQVLPLKLLQLRTAEATAIAAMLNEQYGKRPQSERTAKPVDVKADAGTNTLIVSAHPDLFDAIREFVEEINKDKARAGSRVTELFPLTAARATDVAAAMDRLYPEPPVPVDRLGRPQPWLKQPKEVTVSAEQGSNSLIIDAPAERMESLRELAARLDRVQLPEAAELKTYRVPAASLEAVSKTLASMNSKGMLTRPPQSGKPPVQTVIETEPKSGTLIIAGDSKTFETVEQVLKDLSLVPVEKGLRIFPVANEDAAQVRERALAIYNAQVAQVPSALPIEVTVDGQSNSLMVVAAAEDMQRFVKVMEELQRQTGPAREVRLIDLKLAKAEEVIGFLRDLARGSKTMRVGGGVEPAFEPIEATNSIMVAAQPQQFAVIEALVRSLDNRANAERPPLRILRLKTTDAANLAAVLQKSFDARPADQKGVKPVSIEADAATNTLIVSAHPDMLPEIEKIVGDLNEQQSLDADGREIRIFPLKVARAEELAQTIDQMFPDPPVPIDPRTRQPRPDLKPTREVVVRADRATNSLIVDAPVKRLAGFEQIVRSLDQQKLAADTAVRSYRLERADARAVATTLRNLAASGGLGNTGAAAPVTIDAEPATSTLIVSGPAVIFEKVEEVLKGVDGVTLPSMEMKLFPLRSARAERLQPLVERVLSGRARELLRAQGVTPPPGESGVEVSADAQSNTLIVSAPAPILTIADAVIASLDNASVAGATEMRVVKLTKGDAVGAAKAAEAAMKAQALPGETPAVFSPDAASNSIIVVGTTAQVEKAAALIAGLDVAVDKDGVGVRTIRLKNARAESLAPVLKEVLERESGFEQLPNWARAQALADGFREPPPVRVVGDARMNTLVVSGPKAVLDLAEQIASQLDSGGVGAASARPIRIVTLINADATQMAENLSAVLAARPDAKEPPVIRVDAASNSLIVTADDEQMREIDALTARLDRATVAASRQMKMVPVNRSKADAELVARTLQRLLQEQGGVKVEVISAEDLLKDKGDDDEPPKGGGKPRSQVIPGLHSAIAAAVIASASTGAEAEPAAEAGLLEESPEPAWVKETAEEALAAVVPAAQPEPKAEEQPEEEGGVTIAVDRATNSLIILGSPRMADRISLLAQQLQDQIPPEPTGVKIVTLGQGVEAQPIADMVRAAVQQIGRATAQNPGGFTGPVSVMPDPTGDAVIVLSNETDFATVGRLIASVGRVGESKSVTLKVYPLSNSTADRVLRSVQDLFSQRPQGRQAQRVRQIDLSMAGPEGPVSGRIDPSQVTITAAPTNTAVVVAAPAEAIALIDRLIAAIDQSPVTDRLAIRRYDLKNARADELSRTFQTLFDSQRQGPEAQQTPQARFVPDERTNSILVTANEQQHQEVTRLLTATDSPAEDGGLELAIITLRQAAPTTVQRIVEEVVIGRDPAKRNRVRISANDGSSLFVVRAGKEDLEQVKSIVAQVDTAETSGLPVRAIKLERADAQSVAQALTRFFQERAAVSSRPGQRMTNRVAVVGDRRTGTLVVSAGDEDFEQVQSLVKTFDTPTPGQDFEFKVIPLKNGRVADLAATIKNVVDELRWDNQSMGWGFGWGREDARRDETSIYIEPNERTNSLVVVGKAEQIATVERVITTLDQPDNERSATVVRSVEVKNADLQAVRTAVQQAFQTPGWRSWRGPDPDGVLVEIDRLRRAAILVGKAERVAAAEEAIRALDGGAGGPGQKIESITLQHAKADRAGQSLRQFFADRARAVGVDASAVSITGSPDGNVLIVAGDEENLRILRDLVAQMDQPDAGKDRRIEVYVLANATPADAATTLRAMFGGKSRSDEQVIVTPQPSTNSLIVSAPAPVFEQVEALLKQIDAPPTQENVVIETVALSSARAQDAAAALRTAMPSNVKVTITPVARSNTLMLTGSREAIALVMEQIRKIDTEPVRSGLVFRKFRLENAEVSDVAFTIEQMLRARPRTAEAQASVDYSRDSNALSVYAPADQLEEIEKMVKELDVPSATDRTTEFIKLKFAKAESAATALRVFYGRFAPEAATPSARKVTVLSDAASNSLVVSADKSEWEGIRALLAKLDSEEYDTSRQLAVIPLIHAEAAGVARALNEGLRAPLEEQFRREQIRVERNRRGQNDRDQREEPTVLVDAKDLPTVSAEPQTNSLIVFANQQDMTRIREIVRQLDVAGFDDMPQARIIALKTGKPSQVAQTIRELYLNRTERAAGPRSVLIIGDDAAGALIVRADEARYAQIKALAETLQEQGEAGRVMPHVVRLKHVSAGRLRQTILATFTETARAQGESLAVEVDRTANALVIASSARLLEEIRKVIEELDAPAGGAGDGAEGVNPLGQSVFIADVTHNDPEQIAAMLTEMGVTRPQPVDRPGLVSEPVTISVMKTRRALAILAAPGDGAVVRSLVKSLDAEPIEATQSIGVIPLKTASVGAVAATLRGMLSPEGPAAGAGPSRALAEQVRRLGLLRTGAEKSDKQVDLSKPVRLIPDEASNSLLVASTPGNIDAIREFVKALDVLPLGDAVVVRIFPLENASAARIKGVVDQLFAQGEELRRLPGTNRQGLPPTATGQALAGEISVTVDERTNTLIVAGREEGVALVEVLLKDLDSDRAGRWVEPAVIVLKHADARGLAEKINTVLVRGAAATPEAAGLQRQFARLRMVQADGAPAAEGASPIVEADLFAPVTGLVVTADESLNALLVVATPNNIAVVRALAAQLDVPAASAANTAQVFPLKYAAADRVSAMVRDFFEQRARLPGARTEDAVIVTTDVRTNSLIVSTSPRSFAVLETLLRTLDGEKTNFSVGLHVIAVENGDVRTLAPRIERLMRERISAAAQSGAVRSQLDAFSIEPEPISNLLIVACSDENLAVVRELVRALTEDAARLAGSERVEVIQLSKARAEEAAASIGTIYVQKELLRRGPNAVSVTPNERLNALVVSGNEQDIIEVRALVNRLDQAEVTARQQIRWIELKSANAVEVVSLLESVLAGRPVGGGRGVGARQATKLQFLRDRVKDQLADEVGRPPTEADVDGAIKDQVTLTADQRTNSVWITAPEPMVVLIAEMVEDIERSSAGSRRIVHFRLKNADARQMAELLRDTFSLRQQGNSLVLVPTRGPVQDGPPGAEGAAPPSQNVTPVPDERQQLAIAIDARTNTLVVSGTEEYLELVSKLVMELDDIEANSREQRVYHLRNAKAKELETTLTSYFRGAQDQERRLLGPSLTGSLQRQLEEEVTVVGDENSNKIVVSTSPRYMETVMNIVRELDSAPPQVVIQVLLAEVTVDSSDEWGMDISAGPFGGDAFRFGTLAGQAGVATSLGVPNLSVSSADFSLLIRALQAQGKLEVLSNPQVTVSNNQEARIQVGENVAIVDGVERSSQGNSFADVIRQDVGIILNVVPSISSDGFVRMDVRPEISALSARTVQISEDVESPIITKRQVETVVTVKDGQSVVIGGLIQSNEERRSTKVPILGSIPILGIPFRSHDNRVVKTELLVILTPRIIPGATSGSDAAEKEQDAVTRDATERLEDPAKVEDYLERVRQEIRRRRGIPTDSIAQPTDGVRVSPQGTDSAASLDKGGGR